MSGIQTPIGIDTVNAVDANYKIGPWSSVAAAKAGIPLVVRYGNMFFYVAGDPNIYYWLDTDLSDTGLLSRSPSGGSITVQEEGVDLPLRPKINFIGATVTATDDGINNRTNITITASGSAPLSVTRAALNLLISGSTIIVGQVYSITDAADVNYANGESLLVNGVATNLIGTGIWNKSTNIKPTGKISFNTGTSGSITAVTIGGTNVLSATIPYATSRVNTITNVVANINAGTATHKWKAYLITGNTLLDIPTMVVERQTLAAGTFTFTVTATGIIPTVANNTIIPANGLVSTLIQLTVKYDSILDKFVYAKDESRNIEFSCSSGFIASNNPIPTFWWGDIRFINWRISDCLFNNCFILSNATSFSTTGLMANNFLSECVFSNMIIGRFSGNRMNRINFNQISSGTTFDVIGNTIELKDTMTVTNITSGRAVAGFGAFSNNVITSLSNVTTTAYNISNVSSGAATNWTFSGNTLYNTVAISGATVAMTSFTISGNNLGGTLAISNYVGLALTNNNSAGFGIQGTGLNLGTVTASRNTLYGNMVFSPTGGTNNNFTITDNTFYGSGLLLNAIFNGGASITNNVNAIVQTSTTITFTASFTLTSNPLLNLQMGGTKTHAVFSISNTFFYGLLDWTTVLFSSITINRCIISDRTVWTLGSATTSCTLNLTTTEIISSPSGAVNTSLTVPASSTLTIVGTKILPTTVINVASTKTLNITQSTINKCTIFPDIYGDINNSDLVTAIIKNGGSVTGTITTGFAGQLLNTNWVFTDNSGSGSIGSLTGTTLTITTADNGSLFEAANTYILTPTIVTAVKFTFSWSITTNNTTGIEGRHGMLINGVPTKFPGIVNNGSLTQSGTTTIILNVGDTLGFYSNSVNDGSYTSTMTVNNLSSNVIGAAKITMNSTSVLNGTLSVAPGLTGTVDFTGSRILSSTTNLDCASTTNFTFTNNLVNLSTINIISSTSPPSITNTKIETSTINIRSSNTAFSNVEISNSLITTRNFNLNSSLNIISFTRTRFSNTKIGFEILTLTPSPAPSIWSYTDVTIINLRSFNLDAIANDYYYYFDAFPSNAATIAFTQLTVDGRKASVDYDISGNGTVSPSSVVVSNQKAFKNFVTTSIAFYTKPGTPVITGAPTVQAGTYNFFTTSFSGIGTPVLISDLSTNTYNIENLTNAPPFNPTTTANLRFGLKYGGSGTYNAKIFARVEGLIMDTDS